MGFWLLIRLLIRRWCQNWAVSRSIEMKLSASNIYCITYMKVLVNRFLLSKVLMLSFVGYLITRKGTNALVFQITQSWNSFFDITTIWITSVTVPTKNFPIREAFSLSVSSFLLAAFEVWHVEIAKFVRSNKLPRFLDWFSGNKTAAEPPIKSFLDVKAFSFKPLPFWFFHWDPHRPKKTKICSYPCF